MYTKKLTSLIILSLAITLPTQALKQATKEKIKNTAAGTAWTITAIVSATFAVWHVCNSLHWADICTYQGDYDDALAAGMMVEHSVFMSMLGSYIGYTSLKKAVSCFKKIKTPTPNYHLR